MHAEHFEKKNKHNITQSTIIANKTRKRIENFWCNNPYSSSIDSIPGVELRRSWRTWGSEKNSIVNNLKFKIYTLSKFGWIYQIH